MCIVFKIILNYIQPYPEFQRFTFFLDFMNYENFYKLNAVNEIRGEAYCEWFITVEIKRSFELNLCDANIRLCGITNFNKAEVHLDFYWSLN